MRTPEFKPGFRFSPLDALVLALGIVGAIGIWPKTPWMALVTAFVVGHFFLFCNVFRLARRLELLWASTFVGLVLCRVAFGQPGWAMTFSLSLAMTAAVVALALRQPSYHGVGWRRVNPNLREWWEASIASPVDKR